MKNNTFAASFIKCNGTITLDCKRSSSAVSVPREYQYADRLNPLFKNGTLYSDHILMNFQPQHLSSFSRVSIWNNKYRSEKKNSVLEF